MVRARMESTKVDGAGPDGDSGAGPGGVTRNRTWRCYQESRLVVNQIKIRSFCQSKFGYHCFPCQKERKGRWTESSAVGGPGCKDGPEIQCEQLRVPTEEKGPGSEGTCSTVAALAGTTNENTGATLTGSERRAKSSSTTLPVSRLGQVKPVAFWRKMSTGSSGTEKKPSSSTGAPHWRARPRGTSSRSSSPAPRHRLPPLLSEEQDSAASLRTRPGCQNMERFIRL